MREGNVYIITYLKVSIEKLWDEALQKYVNNPQGLKKLDCDSRTAIEDGNGNTEITCYFYG